VLTRRDLEILATGAFSRGFAAPIDSIVHGVMIGAQSYSFRDVRPVNIETCIDAFRKCELGYCELWSGHLWPEEEPAARQRRLEPPLAKVGEVSAKFDTAGIRLYAVNYSLVFPFFEAVRHRLHRLRKILLVSLLRSSSSMSKS
jgi:hypothetical protein